jgi:hypothetical protein
MSQAFMDQTVLLQVIPVLETSGQHRELMAKEMTAWLRHRPVNHRKAVQRNQQV